MAAKAQIIDFLLAGYRNPTTDLPLNAGTITVYNAGTVNVAYVWDDRDKTLPTTTGRSTITLDASGQAEVYGDGVYKFVVKDALGSTVETIDYAEYVSSQSENVGNIAELADTYSESGKAVYVSGRVSSGDGGEGHFIFDSSNLSTEVTSDTLSGVYVAPTSDLTGASGAWVRQFIVANVLFWGATGDGTTDDTAAVQASIVFTEGESFKLYFPDGIYRTISTIAITKGIHMVGPGWEAYRTRNEGDLTENVRGAGAYFYTDTYTGIQFTVTAQSGVTFEDIAFDQLQPTPFVGWTPTVFNWRIFTGSCEDLKIKNVLMRKATKGIRVDNSDGGAERLTIDGLSAHNLGTLIDIDFQSDVNRINDLHVWPFWSLDQSNIKAYTLLNSVSILSGRNDNPLWSNIFVISQKHGIEFKNSDTSGATLITNKFHLSNCDLDICAKGIYIPSGVNGVTGQISNVTIQNLATTVGSVGVELLATGARIQASNLRVTKSNAQALRIGGSGNRFSVDNLECDQWGNDTTSAAIAVDANNTLMLGSDFTFREDLSSLRWAIQAGAKLLTFGGSASKVGKDATVQIVQTATPSVVSWQVNIEDGENMNINLGSNNILPEVPGVYNVRSSVKFDSSVDNSIFAIDILVNGAAVVTHSIESSGVNPFTIPVAGQVRVDGLNDVVSIRVTQSTGGPVNLGVSSAETFFEMSRIE